MKRRLHDLKWLLWVRRCSDPEGCDLPDGDGGPHTHHLTWLGRRRLTR